MIMNVKSCEGRIPIYSSAENINGRMYNEDPSEVGIHFLSVSMIALRLSMKRSSGSAGIHILSAEIFKRFKLSAGRKINASPVDE
jgi:hypothetical protein